MKGNLKKLSDEELAHISGGKTKVFDCSSCQSVNEEFAIFEQIDDLRDMCGAHRDAETCNAIDGCKWILGAGSFTNPHYCDGDFLLVGNKETYM